jgi:monofunctional biosynthetic peptidoglycan transglycosylase
MWRSKSIKRKSKKKTSLKRQLLFWGLKVVTVIFLLSLLPVAIYKYVNPPTTPLMWIRWMENEKFSPSPIDLERWVPLSNISENLIKAVVVAEDGNFFRHSGFDWGALGNAFLHNLSSSGKLGASTITMQTARNAFLWQSRTWFRKILEAYYTVLIETFWDKGRILEVYLNIIEWGDGIFGCSKATQFYFSKPVKSLDVESSAWLASILPNPRVWSKVSFARKIIKSNKRIIKGIKVVKIPLSISMSVSK